MKVIFLDVDGVLNHSACPEWEHGEHRVLDAKCVKRVRSICDRTGARIVVSSTWRLGDGMKPLLAAFGERIIGVTIVGERSAGGLYVAVPRSDEIRAWIQQNINIPLEIVVVDDDADAEVVPFPFVRTGFETGGLTDEAARKIEAAFQAPPDQEKP